MEGLWLGWVLMAGYNILGLAFISFFTHFRCPPVPPLVVTVSHPFPTRRRRSDWREDTGA